MQFIIIMTLLLDTHIKDTILAMVALMLHTTLWPHSSVLFRSKHILQISKGICGKAARVVRHAGPITILAYYVFLSALTFVIYRAKITG